MFNHQKFKELREARGLTIFGVAAELHHAGHSRSEPTVRSWEEGRVQPRTDDLVAVAGVLGVRPEELLTNDAGEPTNKEEGHE